MACIKELDTTEQLNNSNNKLEIAQIFINNLVAHSLLTEGKTERR